MEKLVNKWFLGLDRPTAGGAYRQVAGQLFVNGATYTDIHQGYLGDCYFMSSLGEVALKNQAAITNMFIVNGDGTYTVRFYHNGVAEYVTVDSYLPTNSGGALIYANRGANYNNASNELWTALAEKAYVQMNEMGWTRGSLTGTGQNSYAAIEGGYIYAALGHITGQATTAIRLHDRHHELHDIRQRLQPRQDRSASPRSQRRHQPRSSAATPTPSSATTPRTKPSRCSIRGASNTAW